LPLLTATLCQFAALITENRHVDCRRSTTRSRKC